MSTKCKCLLLPTSSRILMLLLLLLLLLCKQVVHITTNAPTHTDI